MPTLFVVIPIFNESRTVRESLARVQAVALPNGWSISPILVDDGSDSHTAQTIDALALSSPPPITVERHPVNRGKGAALRSGFACALSLAHQEDDAVIIHDADLEYDPQDFIAMIAALPAHPTQCAVFGNRWHGGSLGSGLMRRLHHCGNRFLTLASNLVTGLSVSDMECCYKLFSVGVLRQILPALTEDRFGIEPQIAAALARANVFVREVPVSYSPRSFSQGKKIGPRDAFRALWVIARGAIRR